MFKRSMETIDTIYGTFHGPSKRRIDLTYDYEDAHIRALRRMADQIRATRFLDIGANIGVYSVYLASVSSLKSIHAFEPAPATYNALQQNIRLQRDERLVAAQLALSDQNGTAEFIEHGELAGDNALASTDPSRKKGTTISVETRRWDDEFRERGERFVAKIDVEGHELAVVQGGAEYLRSNEGVVQIECFGPNRDVLVELMAELGYRRLGWLKHDQLFSNLDPAACEPIVDIVFEEVAVALKTLQEHKRHRREATRAVKQALDVVRYDTDPTLRRS